MRLKIASLRRVVKGELRVEFVRQDLTSYGGLEFVRRYFRLLDLNRRLRQAFSAYGFGGDYGCGRLVLLVVALFLVGARRLEPLRYVARDPLFARLCGLARIPTDRTVVNWLKQFTQEALHALITLNSELLYEQIERLGLGRRRVIFGEPAQVHAEAAALRRANGRRGQINTAYIERDNLTLRQELRRLARKTLGFSKNRRELQHALDFIDAHDNFVKGAGRPGIGTPVASPHPRHGGRSDRSQMDIGRVARLQAININIVQGHYRLLFFEQHHPLLLKMRPIDLLDTEDGAAAVMRLIEGLESGAFS